MLSKKHYQTFADMLRTVREGRSVKTKDEALDVLQALMVLRFAQDNPRFQAERFLRAAGADLPRDDDRKPGRM